MVVGGRSPGVEVVKRLHAAYNRRDRDALLACIADGVVWHAEGDNPFAGTYEGRDSLWQSVFEPLWESPARVRDEALLQHGDLVVSLQQAVHNFGDGERTWPAVEVLQVTDGRVAERWEFTTERGSLDELLRRGCPAP